MKDQNLGWVGGQGSFSQAGQMRQGLCSTSLSSGAQATKLMGHSHRSQNSWPRAFYGSPLPTGHSFSCLEE